MSDDKATKIALPEVKIDFPGAGGTQRVMRMAVAAGGLSVLLKGSRPRGQAGAGNEARRPDRARDKLVDSRRR